MATLRGGTLSVDVPISLSHDGSLLFAASGAVAKIVATRSGLTRHTLCPGGPGDRVSGLFVNRANPRQLVCGTQAGLVCVYDVEDGTLLRQINLGGRLFRLVAAGPRIAALTAARPGAPETAPGPGAAAARSAQKECIFFKSGACRNGARCHFAHISKDGANQTAANASDKQLQVSFLDLDTEQLTAAFFVPNCRGLAASESGDFVGSFYKTELIIFDVKRGVTVVVSHRFDIWSVAFHPRRPVFVLGDRRGQMHVKHVLDGGSPVVEVLHWHAYGVHTMLYTGQDGNLLMSGGTEDCLVVWQLETRKKMFVPHLGSMGVYNLAVSGNGRLIACICADNSVFIIQSSDLHVKRRIMGLRSMAANLIKTTRMLVSPLDSRCLVFSGKANTLQWYNIEQDVCAYELTVLRGTVEPRDAKRSTVDGPASRVEHAAFGSHFLATIYVRQTEEKATIERNLKFWRPSQSRSGQYELACLVLRPHSKRITSMSANQVRDEFCTLGRDGSWKIWRLHVNEDGETSAVCVQSQLYKGLKPKCCAFSADGSLLVVMYYGSILTLWNPLHGTLLHVVAAQGPYLNTVAINSCPNSSLIVGLVPGEYVWVFDLISCRIRYRVRVDVADMAVHWREGYFAMVTYSGRVLLMSCLSPQPIWSRPTKDGMRVQFAEMSNGTCYVSVLDKGGAIEMFEAPEVSHAMDDESTDTAQSASDDLSSLSASSSSRSRFEGLLGVSVPAAQVTVGRNNVSFPSTFLPESASHVLPANTLMLSSLMNELLRTNAATAASQTDAADDGYGTVLMDVDDDEVHRGNDDTNDAGLDGRNGKKHKEKLPHHFSSEDRGELASFFKEMKL